MTDRACADEEVSSVAPETSPDRCVDVYETEEGVVLFDELNPLAWIEARRTIRLIDAA